MPPPLATALAAGALFAGVAAPAAAEGPPLEAGARVALRRRAAPDPALDEAALRLTADLASAGIVTEEVACLAGSDPGCPPPAGAPFEAAVTLDRAGAALVAEISAPAPGGRRPVGRIEVPAEGAATEPLPAGRLAVKAAERVRAHLVAVRLERRRAAARAAAPSPPAIAATSPPAPAWGVDAGALHLAAAAGGASAWGGSLAALWAPDGAFGARLRADLAPLGPAVRGAAGSARVSQALLLASVVRAFSAGRRLSPALSLGAGVTGVRAVGAAIAPNEATTEGRVSVAIEAGGELAVDLGRAFALVGRVAVVTYHPAVILRIAGVEEARLGRPSISSGLALRWRAGR